MTRTTRANPSNTDKEGEPLPRFFSKHGFADQDPNKIKKEGHGRGNWGRKGEEELDDLEGEFNFHHSRRRSNSMSGQRNFDGRYDNQNDEVFEEDEEES